MKGRTLGNNSFLLLGLNSLCVSSCRGRTTHPPLLGDVPDGTSSGTGTRGRERTGTHKTPTRSLSLTENWCRVIWKGTGEKLEKT